MARLKKLIDGAYPPWGICVHHPDHSVGWIVGEDMEVLTYHTQEEAEKALKQMKRGKHYSWHHPTEVKEFTGFGK